jgi:hypothetical protein|nr:MAG TPA: Lower collar protein [Caudoviricetes sp.]
MAKYTIELGRLLENHFNIGLKDYPIFDENYREALNEKIINHYYFREIGMETAELFKRYLNTTMREIMPYYNQLYKSELLEFNPFYNVDKTIDYNRTGNTTTENTGENTDTFTGNVKGKSTTDTTTNTTDHAESEGKTTDKNKTVGSDTPQGFLSINSINNDTYATNAAITEGEHVKEYETTDGTGTTTTHSETESETDTDNKNIGVSKNNGKTDNTENYISHVLGKSEGETYSEMLIKFRETFLNIDLMVIDELKTCFMMIY